MTDWKLRVLGVLTILVIILFLHIKLFQFAEIVHQGALKTLVCLGRVTTVDTSDEADQILTFQVISGEFRGQSVKINNIWTGARTEIGCFGKGMCFSLKFPSDTKFKPQSKMQGCSNISVPHFCSILQVYWDA